MEDKKIEVEEKKEIAKEEKKEIVVEEKKEIVEETKGDTSEATNDGGETLTVEVESTNFNPKIVSKKVSPFIKQDKTWDDEEFSIPENIKKGIIDELKWNKPSKIQNNAIPLIAQRDEESKEFENVIAQAKNGAGKSGAFVIGSLLRVDPKIQKLQVIVIGHTRELVNQLQGVFQKAVYFAPEYQICNLAQDKLDHKAQIIVSTFGTLHQNLQGRNKLDLSALRVFVLDEADTFFLDNKHKQELDAFITQLKKLKNKVQFVFFSATFEQAVSDQIAEIITDASQIVMKVENIKLDNVKQFYVKCPNRGKIDFIQNLFESFEKNTQTIIFVNTKNFADIVYQKLNDNGYRCYIIFGNLEKDERDRCIEKFRKGEINVLIATNLISRGFDMHTIKCVINFDVPFNQGKPDYESYLHRIGRAGRFGDTGVALTLFDREQDELAFFDIIKHYKMENQVQPLEGGAKQLSKLIEQANEESIF